MGGLGGIAGTMATGGPLGGIAGAEAGSMAGQYATDYIGKKIGVGLFPQSKARKDYKAQQDLQKKYIGNTDNGQKYDVVETGYGLKRKGKFKKGSQEAKDHMKRIREMKR
jgi:hypothetical protein